MFIVIHLMLSHMLMTNLMLCSNAVHFEQIKVLFFYILVIYFFLLQ